MHMGSVGFIIFQLVVLIFSVMIHEISHGYVAERLGDPTARLAGRLTLNPLKHLDPVGSVLLPLLFFLTNSPVMLGWAKPVPYNPLGLSKDYRYGPLKVALAGPAANLLMFVIFGFGARLLAPVLSPNLAGFFGFIAYMNVAIAVFNLLPIPPLDGSKVLTLFFPNSLMAIERMGFMGIIILFLFIYVFWGVILSISSFLFSFVAGPDIVFAVLRLITLLSGHG